MNSPEVFKGAESNAEAPSPAAERQAELLKNPEKSVEASPDSQAERVDNARKEAESVISKEAGKERRSGGEPTLNAVRRVTNGERSASYKVTMQHIRTEMSAPSRAFSKLIHLPAVEKSSELIGSSFARPNAILAGSMTAFVLVSLTYVLARTFGYELSGFETIAAFILGWTLGIIYDYVRIMAFGKKA